MLRPDEVCGVASLWGGFSGCSCFFSNHKDVYLRLVTERRWSAQTAYIDVPVDMVCTVKLWEVRKRRKLLHKQSVSICTATTLRLLAFLLKLQMPKANFLKCFNYSTFHILIIDLVPQLYFLQVLFKWSISRAVSDDFNFLHLVTVETVQAQWSPIRRWTLFSLMDGVDRQQRSGRLRSLNEGPKVCQENLPAPSRQQPELVHASILSVSLSLSKCRRRNRDTSGSVFPSSIVQFCWVCEL